MKKLLGVIIVFTFTINLTFGAQNEEIVPNGNLVIEGIPKVPAALAQKISRYTSAYGFRLAGWDLNKREVLLKNQPHSPADGNG